MVAVKRPAPSDAAPEKKFAAQKQQQPQPMEEEDFPRGGGAGLSALQRRELRQEGAAEAEREFKAGGGAIKRRKREVVCIPLKRTDVTNFEFPPLESMQGRR